MQFLNPCNDVAFKKIFGSEEHKNVTISFLNSILEFTGEQEITNVQFLNTEQKRILQGKKDNILDILCTDQAGNKYIIEIQVAGVKEFGKRIVFYAAKAYAIQLGSAQSYQKLEPIIAVSVLDFVLFPDKTDYKSIHLILDKKTHEHDLKELSFAFIELPKFNKQEHELVTHEDKWIYFLKNIDQAQEIPKPLNNNEFKEACQTANRMTWTEEEFNYYENAIIAMTDEKGKIEFALEQGEAKGRTEEKLNAANNLLKLGKLSAEEVAKITGLNLDTITQLKKDLHNE